MCYTHSLEEDKVMPSAKGTVTVPTSAAERKVVIVGELRLENAAS